jgi:hypothetical protein
VFSAPYSAAWVCQVEILRLGLVLEVHRPSGPAYADEAEQGAGNSQLVKKHVTALKRLADYRLDPRPAW